MELYEKLIADGWNIFGPIIGLRFQFLSKGANNFLLFDQKENKAVVVVDGTVFINPTDEEIDILTTKSIPITKSTYSPPVDDHSMHL